MTVRQFADALSGSMQRNKLMRRRFDQVDDYQLREEWRRVTGPHSSFAKIFPDPTVLPRSPGRGSSLPKRFSFRSRREIEHALHLRIMAI
jgi:hypothetical protein